MANLLIETEGYGSPIQINELPPPLQSEARDKKDHAQALMRKYEILVTNEQDVFVQQSVISLTPEQDAFI